MSWGYVAVAGATLISGYMSSKSSKDAAKAGNKGDQAALDWLQQNYGKSEGNFQPYLDLGKGYASGLQALMNNDYSGFMNSPDYKVGLQAQQDQLANKQAAHYNLFSGGGGVDRDRAAQDYALGQFNNYRNFLMQGANQGQNAAGQLGSIGNGTGAQISSVYGNMGQTNAMNAINQGQIASNTIGSLAGLFGDYKGQKSAYGSNWG